MAGAAGALGAAGLGAPYPYITMDGAYHARTSGQPSSLAPLKYNSFLPQLIKKILLHYNYLLIILSVFIISSKDGSMNKSGSEMMSSQKPGKTSHNAGFFNLISLSFFFS